MSIVIHANCCNTVFTLLAVGELVEVQRRHISLLAVGELVGVQRSTFVRFVDFLLFKTERSGS